MVCRFSVWFLLLPFLLIDWLDDWWMLLRFFSKWLFFSINCFVDRWCFKLTYVNKIIHFFVVITLATYSLWYSNGFIWHVFKRAHRIDEAFKENLLMAFILFISHVTWIQRFSPQNHRTKKAKSFLLSLSLKITDINSQKDSQWTSTNGILFGVSALEQLPSL